MLQISAEQINISLADSSHTTKLAVFNLSTDVDFYGLLDDCKRPKDSSTEIHCFSKIGKS